MQRRPNQATADMIGPDRGWVAGQMLLSAAGFVLPPLETLATGQRLTLGHPILNVITGIAVMAGGIAIAGRARQDLAENFQVSPTPRDSGRLVDTGIYAKVRHPMYLAVTLEFAGWSIVWGAISGLALTVLGIIFFTLKSRHEERLLVERYPDYPRYRTRVRARFIPRLW